MITYSVSDVANMLGVNEETIRRWIRDGKLNAKRGLGRGGNSLLLEDVVEFANRPPRAYLLYLVAWLEQHGIAYQRVEDSAESKDVTKKAAIHTSIATATASTIAAAMGPAGIATSIGLAAAGAASSLTAIKGGRKKSYHTFSVKLTDTTEESPSNGASACPEACPLELIDEDGFTVYENDTVGEDLQQVDAAQNLFSEEDADIEEKIREEQLTLIRLRQELAQIQAKIAVAEGQIEYYNLLRKK